MVLQESNQVAHGVLARNENNVSGFETPLILMGDVVNDDGEAAADNLITLLYFNN